MPYIIDQSPIIRLLQALVLITAILFLVWSGARSKFLSYGGEQVAFGLTPVSAVREVFAKQIQRVRGDPAAIDTFHFLFSQPWKGEGVEDEVIVLYERQGPLNPSDPSELWVCFALARAAMNMQTQGWESGYMWSMMECYVPDHMSFSVLNPTTFSARQGFVESPKRKWITYGKVRDPRVTAIEVTTYDGGIGTTPVIHGAFLITLPPEHDIACRIRALTDEGEVVEDFYPFEEC